MEQAADAIYNFISRSASASLDRETVILGLQGFVADGEDDEGERLSKYSADAFPRLSGRRDILVNMRVTAKQIQYDRMNNN